MGNTTKLLQYSDSFLSVTSFLIGFLVLYSFCRVQTLRKPPGLLVLWACICQTVLDVIWSSDSISELSGLDVDDLLCKYRGGLKVYILFLGWSYNTCLCIEILIRMRKPMGGFNRRSKLYHSLSHLISIGVSLGCLLSNSYGRGEYKTCLFREESSAGYLLFTPFLFHYPLVIFVIYKAHRMKNSTENEKTKEYLTRYSRYLIIYTIFSMFVVAYYMLASDVIPDQPVLSKAIISISAFSGVTINSIRLADPAVKKFLKSVLKKIARKIKKNVLKYTFRSVTSVQSLNEETLVVEYVQDLANNTIMSYLIGIFISLLKSPEDYDMDVEDLEIYTEKRCESIRSRDFNILSDINLSQRCKIYTVSKYSCDVKEYAPRVFNYMRCLDGISNYDIADAFDPVPNLQLIASHTTSRCSRDFTYMTYNRRYIIKAVHSTEQKFILRNLKRYLEYRIQNSNSLLCKVYGIFTLTLDGSIYKMIIVQNLFYTALEFPIYYDLDGSIQQNQTHDQPTEYLTTKSLKKYNSRKSSGFMLDNQKISISEHDKELLKELIDKDITFLDSIGSAGYRLRLGVFNKLLEGGTAFRGAAECEGKLYMMGFIHYFNDLSMKKKMKNIISGIFKSRGIVVKNSADYARRLKIFLFDVMNLS